VKSAFRFTQSTDAGRLESFKVCHHNRENLVEKICGTKVVCNFINSLGQSGKVNLNRNRKTKAEKQKSETVDVPCSWCGAAIGSDARVGEERMCVICHARMLNDYLYNIKKESAGKNGTSPGAPKVS